ncbi:MAG: phosphocholine cytidylyltransferase family protein [Desulfovibrionales bacterium]|nr:MAG: phosphocholine cytidylyltransferase family protein [Desulfovibrionales bacterium]
MKAVILAAGVGSRLGRPFPKCMSLLPDGEQILGRQIRLFREAGIRELIVVVGFKKGLIMEEFPDVFYTYNPFFYITNTSKSLLCVLEHLDDDVIWANGDVVFDREVVEAVVAHPGNVVAVDRKRCGAEEVKYRADGQGRLLEISKQVDRAHGEAVGVNRVSREDLPTLVRSLTACQDDDYFEKGIEDCLGLGVAFQVLDISAHRCIEVDFDEDLREARRMFGVESSRSAQPLPSEFVRSELRGSHSGLELMRRELSLAASAA